MGMGVQIFDGSGNLTFDSSDSLARILGAIPVTGGVSGYADVNMTMGRPFFFFQQNDDYWGGPVVTYTTTRITWTFPGGFGKGGTIFYGYY